MKCLEENVVKMFMRLFCRPEHGNSLMEAVCTFQIALAEQYSNNKGILSFGTKWLFLTEEDGKILRSPSVHHFSILEIEEGSINKVSLIISC